MCAGRKINTVATILNVDNKTMVECVSKLGRQKFIRYGLDNVIDSIKLNVSDIRSSGLDLHESI